MAKYRKKPVVIEAVTVLHAERTADDFDGQAFSEMPLWLDHALQDKVVTPSTVGALDYMTWIIETLEGDMTAGPGDYIIRGIKGELYPCKPDIFKATYAPAGEPMHPPTHVVVDFGNGRKVDIDVANILLKDGECLRATCHGSMPIVGSAKHDPLECMSGG